MTSPPSNPQTCRRCGAPDAPHLIRSEPLCDHCLQRYIYSKTSKRLDFLRVRSTKSRTEPEGSKSSSNGPAYGAKKRILLPLSFGPASLTLLHVLCNLARTQRQRTGTVGFTVVIVHVAYSLPSDPTHESQRTSYIKSRIEEHGWTLHTVYLTETWADPNQPLSDHLTAIVDPTDRKQRYDELISSEIERLVSSHQIEAVCWAESTTRLAERVLSLTAKGRGGEIPSLMSEELTAEGWANVRPLREVLSREIEKYVQIVEWLREGMKLGMEDEQVGGQGPSKKNMTIDGIMRRYFEKTEVEYPSIVANVVKTAGRLRDV